MGSLIVALVVLLVLALAMGSGGRGGAHVNRRPPGPRPPPPPAPPPLRCRRGWHKPGTWVPGNKMQCARCGEIYTDLP